MDGLECIDFCLKILSWNFSRGIKCRSSWYWYKIFYLGSFYRDIFYNCIFKNFGGIEKSLGKFG